MIILNAGIISNTIQYNVGMSNLFRFFAMLKTLDKTRKIISEVTMPTSLKGPSCRANCAVIFAKNIIAYIAKSSDNDSNEISRIEINDLYFTLPLNRSEYKNVETIVKIRVKVGFGLTAYKIVEEANKAKKPIKF